jgi:malonyl CoA-acyl carrier protein transacylase
MIEPLDILKAELEKYEKALRKSKESFIKKQISRDFHEIHMENLPPKIEKFKHAIRTLQIFG